MLEEQGPSDVWNVFLKFEFEAKARPHSFGQSIFIDGQDLEPRLSLFHRLSCSLVPDTLIQERFTNSPLTNPIQKNRLRKTPVAKPCSRSLKGREEIQMGNTHPLNHVPLCWHSAAPGLKPRSIRLRSSKFSSALLVSLPGSNQRNFDTRSIFPQHGVNRSKA